MSSSVSTNFNHGGFNLRRPLGVCSVTGARIEPGEAFITALRDSIEADSQLAFERVDVSEAAWANFDRAGVIAFWKTAMPRAEEKKKLLVDDALLCDLLTRLDGVEDPAKQNFRFVLALILMRKKLVVLESTRRGPDQDVWLLRFRGKDDTFEVIDPRPGEEQIAMVQEQLGEILNQDVP